jgi:hypothetical protein
MWVNPDVEHGRILGYLTGELNLDLLSDWCVESLTQEEALNFALALDENAYLLDNGVIGTMSIDNGQD